jgi:hypothetical protein
MEERKYWVKASYRTNLDTFITKCYCIRYEMEDGEYDEIELLGKKYDIETIYDLIDECQQLLGIANCGKVTGREYGRIKQISEFRDYQRYATCIANGMSEDKASYAFLG